MIQKRFMVFWPKPI